MRFAERLQTLMDVYRLNNIALARGICVDASLVSRWRNGDRTPKCNSPVPADIAAFLAGLGMLQHDRETLVRLLGVPCDQKADLQTALLDWLLGRTPGATLSLEPESPELVSYLFHQLTNVFQVSARAPSAPVSLYPRVQKGTASDHERFEGAAGFRQAVINFFHIVLSCRQPGDVYLMPPPDDTWLHEDAAFDVLYNNTLRTIIQTGHTIHMVHPAPQGSDLGPLLTTYMPLYATGRFVSYGRSESPNLAMPAIFVLKGQAALASYAQGAQSITYFFKHAGDIAAFEQMVHAQVKSCHPLAAACLRETPTGLTERLIQLEDQRGDLYSVKNTLDAIFLPEQIAYEYLSEQLPPDKVDVYLDFLARRRESLYSLLESQPWTMLLPTSVIEAILLNGTCRLSGIELLTPRDVTLSDSALLGYLEELLRLLERYPLLTILFLEDCPMLNVTVKANAGTLFMADSVASQPSGVYVGDASLCDSLLRWFTARNREAVEGRQLAIEQIEEAVDYLR